MRTLTLTCTLTIALAMVPWAAFAQPGTAEFTAEEGQVLAIEDDYVVAEVDRDEAALRRILDDRFVWNRSNGTTAGKEAFIRLVMRNSMVSQVVRERTILLEGDVAFVFGTADLHFAPPGQPETKPSLRYTATYVRRGEQWRMVVLQMQDRAPE